MNKRDLSIFFTDMWGHGEYQFNPVDNYFYDLLSIRYNIILDQKNPDVLIYSCFGSNHLNYDCFKIFFSGENIRSGIPNASIEPDEACCDISFSKHPTSATNYYLPLWVLFVNWFGKFQPRPLPSNPTYATSLCDLTNLARERGLKDFSQRRPLLFINNNFIKDRVYLFLKLQDKIPIDSFGKLFNNMGGPIRGSEYDKHIKLLNYRCTIALENSYFPGYITEKIIQPYAAGCIPIYRGGFDEFTFNRSSMILYDSFNTMDDLVDEVVDVCTNESKWLKYINEPLFNNNKVPYHYTPSAILDWLNKHI